MAEGNFFEVDAQWALQGKTLGRNGYRVLACSTGSLSADHFTEAINRFSMGTPETLPQVTISWLSQGVMNHLALAIHQFASDAQTPDGQLTIRDDDGRPVVTTRYYCVPYEPVADHSISYQAMYEAFAVAPLRPENGPPLPVQLAVPPAGPSAPPVSGERPPLDPLAIKAAALLLTGRPVCVLGGQAASTAERLGFIDTVMALLPYGFRARMTAATWTRATNQNHRFRLFFSGAQRDTDQPDRVVFWGRPERTVLTQDDEYAYWYQNWLNDGQARNVLLGLKQPISFTNRNEVLEALNAIGTPFLSSRKARHSRRYELDLLPKQTDFRGETAPAHAVRSEGEECLLECAQYMEKPDLPELSAVINQLKITTKAEVSPEHRARYRELIAERQLFRHDEALGNLEGKLRDLLFKLAFVPPFSYEDYCLVEDGIGAAAPDSALLQLIEKAGIADPRVKAIVYRQLPNEESEKKLARWYSSKDLRAEHLLNELARTVRRPRHARLLCDVTVEYLRKMHQHYEPEAIKHVLRQHSYLVRALQNGDVGHDQYQISAFCWFLRAAYPDKLMRQDLYSVLIGATEPPTRTFLAAVLLTLENAEDAGLARELYVFSSLMAMNLKQDTSRELYRLLMSPWPTGIISDHPALAYPESHEGEP